MKKFNIAIIVLSLVLMVTGAVRAGDGGGDIKLGYTFNEDEGNRSVNQATFDYYEGAGLSFENFKYRFNNGIYINADLKRITLNNRDLQFGVTRPGLFGVRINNNQYRRIYSFDGDNYTRRHQTGGSLWIRPHRYVKLFGGASFYGKSGQTVEWYDFLDAGMPQTVDYKQSLIRGGAQINHQGGMIRAEFAATDFTYTDVSGDQSRTKMRFIGISPLLMDRLVLQSGFQRFVTKYDESNFEISANTFWGGATVQLPHNFGISYNFIFDRASSDSDLVATDNIVHSFYATYTRPRLASVTVGYQNGIKDDFYDAVKSDAFYFSGWYKPMPKLKFKVHHGMRTEKLDEGARLVGDEDRIRFKISGKYSCPDCGSMEIKYQIRNRNNDELGSEVDFSRFSAEGVLTKLDYGDIAAGYSYSLGEYENPEQEYEFSDHLVHGDITFKEYRDFVFGFGAVYYRSKGDNDVESFTLNFKGSYNIQKGFAIEAKYNVHNFDDFLVKDRYYTANIVEINLIKSISIKGDI